VAAPGGAGVGGSEAILVEAERSIVYAGGIYYVGLSTPNVVATSVRWEPGPAVPSGAIVEVATFRVVVDPPGRSVIGDVAEVRAASPDGAGRSHELLIDFKAMTAVSEVSLPPFGPAITELRPWVGTRFASSYADVVHLGGVASATFPDIQTEKLLCVLDRDAAPEVLLGGQAVLPSPPSFVEILINGVRAWFSPIGAASRRELPGVDGVHAFADVVDLTSELQSALDADGSVRVELRTSSPGQLRFGPAPFLFFRTHDVRFSEGPSRGFDAPEEGRYEVDLPLPDEADTWQVHAVELTLRADIGDTRVRPPAGPTLSEHVELVLEGARTLLVELPGPILSRFATITGVRIPVRAGPAGGELAGELLRDDVTSGASQPGAQVPDAGLTPVAVSPSDVFAYVTLGLATPYEPDPSGQEPVWCTVRATRGEVAWALAVPEPGDELAEADVRWRAPNGVARELSAFSAPGGVGPTEHAGAVRVIGTRDPNRPLDAVTVEMEGNEASASLTPFETGTLVRLDMTDPLVPGSDRSPRALRARFLVSAPGSYTIDGARLIYVDTHQDPLPSEGGSS
jgi:hypothetical protein